MGRAEDECMHVEVREGGGGGEQRDVEGEGRELQRQMTSSSDQAEY